MLSIRGKIWQLSEVDPEAERELVDRYSIPWIVAHFLVVRQITDVDLFLNPKLKTSLKDPLSVAGMSSAVDVVLDSILSGKKILIWGDYDVDGVSSVSILVRFFQEIGYSKCHYFIPNRRKDGYGLAGYRSENFVDTDLVIAVDCGTGDIEKSEEIQKSAKSLVIIDHHVVGEEVPSADAFVNPKQEGDKSVYKDLCACGLVFLFVVALNRALRERDPTAPRLDLMKYVSVAALATVCDVVPLVGPNRAIVATGVKLASSSMTPPGLGLMCKFFSGGYLSAQSFGFDIGPRLNAAGRMDDAHKCVALLTSDNEVKIASICQHLEELNRMRKEEEAQLLMIVEKEAEKQADDNFILVYGQDWNVGVIGIIASRIVEKFQKPAAVVSFNGEIGKGSARSTDHKDLGQIVADVRHTLIAGGGHKKAAGFSVHKNNIGQLKSELERAVTSVCPPDKSVEYTIDLELSFEALTLETLRDLSILAPFGECNRDPTILVKNVTLICPRVFANRHLSCRINSESGSWIRGVMFNYGNIVAGLDIDRIIRRKLSMVGHLEIAKTSAGSVEFRIRDIIL